MLYYTAHSYGLRVLNAVETGKNNNSNTNNNNYC